MKTKLMAATAVAVLALSGCASYPTSSTSYGDQYGGRSNSDYNRVYGTVVDVQNVQVSDREYNGPGWGAVAGAVIGGVLGNQIGSGTGRAVATGVGAIAGGFAGDKIQQNSSGSKWAQDITVRLDNGDTVRVMQPADQQVYKGARVYISGYGKNARVRLR